jgi:hypothetical protein
MAVNVIGMSAGMSGCLIGASGYRAVPLRFVVAALGGFWVLSSGAAAGALLENERLFDLRGERLIFWLGCFSALGVQVLYAITGMQLGRAHLKLALLPGEAPPTRGVVSLMIFLPFILLAGAIGTLFYCFPLVLLLVIYAMCRYDRPWRPPKGRNPQRVTALDTGWRPLS